MDLLPYLTVGCTGKGFPSTFGFVIASLLAILAIQLLLLGEKRRKLTSSDDAEEGSVVVVNESVKEEKGGK